MKDTLLIIWQGIKALVLIIIFGPGEWLRERRYNKTYNKYKPKGWSK